LNGTIKLPVPELTAVSSYHFFHWADSTSKFFTFYDLFAEPDLLNLANLCISSFWYGSPNWI